MRSLSAGTVGGDWWNKGKRARGISLDEAQRALTEGVKACGVCRPDSALGFLEY
ncbi:DUF6233 domain-containing protein [Streptomyces sp. NPDC004976]